MKFPIRLSCLIAIFCQWAAAQAPIEHIIIKPTPGALATSLSAIHQNESLKAAAPSLEFDSALAGGAYRLRLPYAMSPAEAEAYVLSLHSHLDLEYAEPDWRVYPAVIPNDSYYQHEQWNLHSPNISNYGIDMPGAWAITTGSAEITVAVIDTGIVSHEDIEDNRILPGLNLQNKLLAPIDPDGGDVHGTHVTGIIAAQSDNGIGIAGIDWNAQILPVRAIGFNFGSITTLSEGIRWAAGDDSVYNSTVNLNVANVINLSVQTDGDRECSSTLQDAINFAVANDIIVVAAAGNFNLDSTGTSPANCKNVISVGATTYDGNRASYSNYGNMVTLSAPGGAIVGNYKILSTMSNNNYGYLSGTSMAAPHVAGVISLMLAANPLLSQEDIELILIGSATLFPADSDCHSKGCGAGILNAHRALEFASTYDEHLRSLLQNYARLVKNTDYSNLVGQHEKLQAEYEQLQQQILEQEQLQQSQQERIEKRLLGSSGSSSSGGCGAGSSSDATLPAAFSLAGIYLLRPRRNP
ncbi:peptidase S8 and S53 subtilisin kexin sedolisin [Desulfurispirillum indicum S5]|uniref:Peptidase S8 and S53 subtilisin kexin sedolisin n=1 Tax=Desulfurispirillum indicum (strain ATCC BAA-1389 / DSM 22839 / S5) TaxID=653733 RepID=E6W097_DESIS|nr:S8 family serine peptidase [Desulfurispirillum indicum]ADU66315.1 peptidase S8 and S53 subtilisin kexin sedolisin [Desulfurispirillum indicum S5]